jgi:HlyD family secretion protein
MSEQESDHEPPEQARFVNSYVIAVLFFLIIAGSLGFTWYQTWSDRPPDGVLVANGRIEGRDTTISSEVSERIKELHVEEGDQVSSGDLLAQLEQDLLSAKETTAQSRVTEAKSALQRAREELEHTRKQVQADLQVARSSISTANATIEHAQARLAFARVQYQRSKQTYEKNATTGAERDEREMQFKTAKAEVRQAEERLETAKAKRDAALAQKKQIEVKKQLVQEANARLATARSQLQEVKVQLRDTRITSPLDGTVLTRAVEPGELVQPGTPLYSILNLDKLYMKVYVPEPDVGKLKLGQNARVYVDVYPEQPFDATVTKIAQEAEFTPKNVQTREERVKQVFGVELSIDNPDGKLKPGMPGDAVIRLQETAPWYNPL